MSVTVLGPELTFELSPGLVPRLGLRVELESGPGTTHESDIEHGAAFGSVAVPVLQFGFGLEVELERGDGHGLEIGSELEPRSDRESVLCPECWLQFGSGLATVLLVELKSVSHGLRAVVSDFASQGGVGV